MAESGGMRAASKIVGFLMLAAGSSVFLIRFQHAGPYGFPQRGNLLAALLSLAIAGLFLTPWLARVAGARATLVRGLLLAASPIVLFFALYATLAELEEVVVVYATDSSGAPAELRLWIVDYEGVEWVSMPRSKMTEHSLDGGQVELLRRGERRCIVASLSDDPADGLRTFALRNDKYAVQRLAAAVGVFGDGPAPGTVTLRFDPCP